MPKVNVVKSWALEHGIPGTLSVLCANEEVKAAVMDDIITWGQEAGLKSYEQVTDKNTFVFTHISMYIIINDQI